MSTTNPILSHPLTGQALTVIAICVVGYFGFVDKSNTTDTKHEGQIKNLGEKHELHLLNDQKQDETIAAIQADIINLSNLPPRVAQLESFTQTVVSEFQELKLNQSIQQNDNEHMLHDLDEVKDLLKELTKRQEGD